jgi:hypothetical protein
MFFDVEDYLKTIFMVAGGLALMIFVPYTAYKYKGGLQLLAIAIAIGLFVLYDEGYIGH